MSPHKRQSLTGLFGSLDIGSSSASTGGDDIRKLADTLRNSISRAGFPNWRTLRGLSKLNAEPCHFTLKMDQNYRYYNDEQGQTTHQVLFKRASAVIEDVRRTLSNSTDDQMETYAKVIEEDMIHMVFGNNMQERAGQSFNITWGLCMDIFAGRVVDAAGIHERDPGYAAHLRFLHEQNYTNANFEHVIRSRREVIQHAEALKYITDAALNRDQPITESLIIETHRILCAGLTIETTSEGKPVTLAGWEGVYRTTEAAAGSCTFTPARHVPREMGKLIQEFNDDIKNREETLDMDPFYLAADICQDFVNIHPFLDGNGRMCRLIANAFLIKYAGIVISIGEDQADRDKYLSIAQSRAC
jgi:prophage maintenance system killer protein